MSTGGTSLLLSYKLVGKLVIGRFLNQQVWRAIPRYWNYSYIETFEFTLHFQLGLIDMDYHYYMFHFNQMFGI